MIYECSKCGALLFEDAGKCSFCDATLHAAPEHAASEHAIEEEEYASVPANEVEPDWRVEVARRMEIYRARRRRYLPDESQPPLPFQGESHIDAGLHDETTEPAEPPAPARLLARSARKLTPPRAPDRVEISIFQPELDFSAASDDRTHPQTALVPVAPLRERREAGLLDAAFLAFSYVGFGALFHSLGGRLSFTKVDGVVFAATFFLLYTMYFFIFTFFGGATPGMLLRGLYVVRLDGRLADTRHLLWRSFGYLLSGGALMMGFLWALWDDDHFTWHDRMSHTYVTEALPLDISDSLEVGRSQQTFAHK